MASETIEMRINGNKSPLMHCVKISSLIWGIPGMSATNAPIKINAVKIPRKIGASRKDRDRPFSNPKSLADRISRCQRQNAHRQHRRAEKSDSEQIFCINSGNRRECFGGGGG